MPELKDLKFHDLYYRKIPVEALGRVTSTLESNKTDIWRREKMNILQGFVPYSTESVNINCTADFLRALFLLSCSNFVILLPIPGLNYCRHVLYFLLNGRLHYKVLFLPLIDF